MRRVFGNLSIRSKILAGFGGLAAAFVVISALYLGLVVQIQQQADIARRQTLPHVQTINEVRVHGLILINTAVRVVHAASTKQLQKAVGDAPRAETQDLRRAFSERRKALHAAIDALQSMIAAPGESATRANGELAHMEHVAAAAKRIIEESDVLIALASRGTDPEQLDQVVRSYAAAQGDFSKIVDIAAAREMTALASNEDDLGRKVRTTIIASVLGIVGAIGVAMLAGRLIAAHIADPIQQLNAAALRLGQGDFAATVSAPHADEVGELAASFNKMRDDLKDAMDKAARTHRLSMLGQVAGTVSHELRNPLGAIKASLALIRQLSNGKGLGLERSLDRADRAVGRCDGIIADMLEFTRMRDMTRMPTDIDVWLAETLDEHELPKGVTLERDFRAGCLVPLDGDRFRQVLVNLLDNAAQALTDSGWNPPADRVRRITVRTEDAGDRLKLSVIDTGPGIPQEARAKIFEPLFTTKNFGVGLGLPTVQKIVGQHGGQIELVATGAEGTEFVVWLPRMAPPTRALAVA